MTRKIDNSELIKLTREQFGGVQRALSRATGYSVQAVNAWFTGKVQVPLIVILFLRERGARLALLDRLSTRSSGESAAEPEPGST